MQLVSMKLENERTVGVTVTRERSDLNMNQNISNVTANSGDLSRISAIFAMLSAKSQNISNVTGNSGDLSRISAIFAMLSAKSQNISNFTGNSGDLSRDISNLRHGISKEPEYQQF